MNNQVDPVARTGRTTQMCQQAVKLLREGKIVFIVVATVGCKRHVESIMRYLLKDLNEKLRIPIDQYRIVNSDYRYLNWDTMTMQGMNPEKTAVLVDHYVLEILHRRSMENHTSEDDQSS